MEIKQDINFLDKPLWFQMKKSTGDKGFTWQDIDGYVYYAGYKLPEKMDILFLLYILLKSQQAGYKEKMNFTRHEILKQCGLSRDSKAYDRLKDSLTRWLSVSITFEGTFYDGKKYKKMGFHIIDSYEIDENTGKLEVCLNPRWLRKIKDSEFFKYINFNYYKALKRPISRRLFEILCKTFKGRSEWTINLLKLGNKLTLSGKKVVKNGVEIEIIYPNIVLRAIVPAINEINRLAEDKNSLDVLGVKGSEAFKIKYSLSEDKKIITFEKVIPDWVSKEGVEKKSIQEKSKESKRDVVVEELLEIAKSKTKGIREAVDSAYKVKGFDYVKSNILYANKEAKKNYEAFLKKGLEEDWGKGMREEEERKEEEKRKVVEEQKRRFEKSKRLEEERERLNQKYFSLKEDEQKALWEEAKADYLEKGIPESFKMPKEMMMAQIREFLKKRDKDEVLEDK